MRLLHNDLWFCDDCTIVAVYDDASSIDFYYGAEADEREREVRLGLHYWSAHTLAPNWDSETGEGLAEFMKSSCDCCNTSLHGSRSRFAVLTV